jgi:hypothetical protein
VLTAVRIKYKINDKSRNAEGIKQIEENKRWLVGVWV